MECVKVQELLSAYFDDQLLGDARSSVARHLQICSRCGEELAVFGQMSTLAGALDEPTPPEGIWTGIEAALDADPPRRTAAPFGAPSRAATRWRLGLLATAALVLVAAGIVWITAALRHTPVHHAELAADFDRYLDSFATDPGLAQNVLLAKYHGQRVNMAEATEQLGYQPAVAAGLPSGYSLESMYTLDMPCCKCLTTLCRRDDGKRLAIFEHEEEQPVWFGERPCIETQCNGHPCRVIGGGQGIVASWKSNKRQLTVVGARDLEEITDLIAHFQG